MKKHQRCIFCSSLKTRRHGWLTRKGRDRLQRFKCNLCNKSFSLGYTKGLSLSRAERLRLTRTHLEGRTSMRTLASHSGHSKTTICDVVHEVTAQCVSAAWIATELKPQWGGYLALDGKMIRVWDWAAKHWRYTKVERRWLHKMSLLLALDLETLDIPSHHLGDEETTIDLVLLLRELKAINYPLKGYITDGNDDIKKAVELVFGRGVPRQLCIRHYLQNLRAKLGEAKISDRQYHDACTALLVGARPKLLSVPDDLFTYQSVSQLPSTNQQMENLIRYLNLRLKTIGQFHNWRTAKDYCNALTLMRRFIKFTDCRDPAKNHHAPLELAKVDIANLNYLDLKNHTRLVR